MMLSLLPALNMWCIVIVLIDSPLMIAKRIQIPVPNANIDDCKQ
jgi:hypothetical protein